jgi:hypothetical protein
MPYDGAVRLDRAVVRRGDDPAARGRGLVQQDGVRRRVPDVLHRDRDRDPISHARVVLELVIVHTQSSLASSSRTEIGSLSVPTPEMVWPVCSLTHVVATE